MYQFQDGQIGTVVWHPGNKYGEFISTTGARFTVRAAEVQPFSDGARGEGREGNTMNAPRTERNEFLAQAINDAGKLEAANAALRAENAKLREALAEQLAVDERKLRSLEKRPYAIGLSIVRGRVERARAALGKE